ncbi:MAG: hypothetical protein AB7N76_28025 [Planctomycetota bacterium]
MLYHLLAGRPPFLPELPLELYSQIVNEAPAPPSRWRPAAAGPGPSPALDAVCLRALAKGRAERFASAGELAEAALAAAQEDAAGGPRARRAPRALLGAALVLVSGLGVAAWRLGAAGEPLAPGGGPAEPAAVERGPSRPSRPSSSPEPAATRLDPLAAALARAQAALAKLDGPAAEAAAREALGLAPEAPAAVLCLARARDLQMDLAGARELLARLVVEPPRDPAARALHVEAHLLLARLLQADPRAGGYMAIRPHLDAAVALDPQSGRVLTRRGELGVDFARQLQDEGVRQDLLRAMQLEPTSAEVLSNFGYSLWDQASRIPRGDPRRDRTFEEARRVLDHALVIDPADPELWARRAWCQDELGRAPATQADFEQALERFRKAEGLAGHFYRLGRAARLEAEAGDTSSSARAIAALQRALAENGRHPLARAELGYLSYRLAWNQAPSQRRTQQLGASLEHLNKARTLNRRAWEGALWRAELLAAPWEGQNVRTALLEVAAAQELIPRDELWRAHLIRGMALLGAGQPQQALESLEAGLRERQDVPELYAVQAAALQALGRQDEAALAQAAAIRIGTAQQRTFEGRGR